MKWLWIFYDFHLPGERERCWGVQGEALCDWRRRMCGTVQEHHSSALDSSSSNATTTERSLLPLLPALPYIPASPLSSTLCLSSAQTHKWVLTFLLGLLADLGSCTLTNTPMTSHFPAWYSPLHWAIAEVRHPQACCYRIPGSRKMLGKDYMLAIIIVNYDGKLIWFYKLEFPAGCTLDLITELPGEAWASLLVIGLLYRCRLSWWLPGPSGKLQITSSHAKCI